MEIQIKKAIKAGNSSAVILPRSWLNKEVRVELVKKTPDIILNETLNILKKHINSREIIGIYLVGSYARGEEDELSDIDILVITENADKEMISDGIYNIMIISSELLKQKLKKNLFPIGQMIIEAKPLLNSSYLDSIEVKVTQNNIKWYIDTTKEKLIIIKDILDKMNNKNKEYAEDRVVYTIILRIRTLYIIKKLIKNEIYSKKEFIHLINNISRDKNSYERYLVVKNSLKEGKEIGIKEAERLYTYLENQLEEIKKLVKNIDKN